MPVSNGPTIPTESSPGVPAGGFSTWFKNIGDWIKSLSPSGAAEYETAWLTNAAGIQYRRIGKQIEVTLNISTGSYPVGLTTIATGLIPQDMRATFTNPRGVCYFGAAQSGHFYVDNATGDVGVINQTGATRTIAQGRMIYTIA